MPLASSARKRLSGAAPDAPASSHQGGEGEAESLPADSLLSAPTSERQMNSESIPLSRGTATAAAPDETVSRTLLGTPDPVETPAAANTNTRPSSITDGRIFAEDPSMADFSLGLSEEETRKRHWMSALEAWVQIR